MAFLTLNGITIPTASGGDISTENIGKKERAYNGDLSDGIRRKKRRWQFTTPPLSEKTALMVEGLVSSSGHSFQYDSTMLSDRGLYADKALANRDAAEQTIQQIEYATGADGSSMADTAMIKYGNCLATSHLLENLLSSNQSTCENAPTGFTATNSASVAADADHYWQGSKSMSIDASTSNPSTGGVYAQVNGSWPVGTFVQFSVRVKKQSIAANATWVIGIFSDVPDFTTAEKTFTHAGEWEVWTVEHTLTNTATYLRVSITNKTAYAVSDKIYADGLSLVVRDSTSSYYRPEAFNVSFPASLTPLKYENCEFLAGAKSVSMSFWTEGANVEDGSGILLSIYESATKYINILVYDDGGAGRVTVESSDNSDVATASAFNTGTLTNIVVAIRQNIETSENTVEIYAGGTLKKSIATAFTIPDFTDSVSVCVGSESDGSRPFSGHIDNLVVVPYAMTAAAIANLASSTVPFAFPLRMSGDCVQDYANVIGEVTGTNYMQYSDGVVHNNGRVISFMLEEV